MPRALDHLVIAARDLDASAERYRRLGFHVGTRNRHPWGTENHIVQFDGVFLELVGLGPGFVKPEPRDPVFPFAGYLAEFLSRREGLAMVALRSDDAEADRRAFAARGLGMFPRFDFGRKGMRAGREVEVAFSLAFAECAAMPETGFFVCQQRFPENFWDVAAQVHPNGAVGVAELSFVHPRAHSVAAFLSAFLDVAPEAASDGPRFAMTATTATLHAGVPARLAGARVIAHDGSSLWID